MSFYSGRYRSFVPEVFNSFATYHVIVHLHIVHGTGNVVCILPTTALQSLGSSCLCQVDFVMSDRSYYVELASP
ncbi:hypothetical protein BHM03_00033307 [Ensete ventricosum]|nr:hypothetical protein BHM03_00033307 [Ensete ventricosum]